MRALASSLVSTALRASSVAPGDGGDGQCGIDRTHVDDGAAALLHHHPRHGLADEEVAFQIDVDDGVPVGLGDVEKGRGLEDAGVVDEAVDLPEARQRGGQRGVDLRLVCDVAVQIVGLRAGCVQFGDQACADFVGHVPQGHRGAVVHHAAGAGLTDALGRAGDDDHAALQAEVNLVHERLQRSASADPRRDWRQSSPRA